MLRTVNEGVPEVTEITSVEGVGGIFQGNNPINPVVAFDILGGLEELAVAIDQFHFIATRIPKQTVVKKLLSPTLIW